MGENVGLGDGDGVGLVNVGCKLGICEGEKLGGLIVGVEVVGLCEGGLEGSFVGKLLGVLDGKFVGSEIVGFFDGEENVGWLLG